VHLLSWVVVVHNDLCSWRDPGHQNLMLPQETTCLHMTFTFGLRRDSCIFQTKPPLISQQDTVPCSRNLHSRNFIRFVVSTPLTTAQTFRSISALI